MLKLKGLEKYFETKAGRIYVLRNIDLEVAQGEFLTIMGPSGAGKSSLLGILGMLDGGWRASTTCSASRCTELNLKQRAELNKQTIGFVFQQYHLLDNLTVYENLEIPLSYRNVPRSERAAIVADTLDRFNIVGKKDLYPEPAVRRPAAAGGRGARGHRQPEADPGGRADGQPAFRAGPRDHGAVPEAERAGHHDHPGHALGDERRVRPPRHRTARRLGVQRTENRGNRGLNLETRSGRRRRAPRAVSAALRSAPRCGQPVAATGWPMKRETSCTIRDGSHGFSR
jgi:hypothetical protein